MGEQVSAFAIATAPHHFESGLEALEAACAFESASAEFWEYEVRAVDEVDGLPVFVVCVARLASNGVLRPLRGYLAPFATTGVSMSGDRLRQARLNAGFDTAKAFAETHGIAIATYTQHETSTRGFRLETCERYAALLGVGRAWLAFGEGDAPPWYNESRA